MLHGSPGSRLSRYPFEDDLREAGIRLITYDRPGYGGSDRLAGRSVARCVPDIEDLLDELGIDRVGLAGGSGGGPHALAVATLLPERVTVVHVVASLAPSRGPHADELDWFAGMDRENVRRFRAAVLGPERLSLELEPDLASVLVRAEADPVTMWGPMDLPEVDRVVARRMAKHGVPGMREAARQGAAGWVDDFWAFTQPWGFDPAGAAAPVVLSYGRVDVNVPAHHGDWLAAHVPTADIRVDAEAGHASGPEVVLARYREMAAVGERAGRAAQDR